MIVEGALVVLDVVTVVVAASRGVWVVAVYSAIFASGLAGAVTATLHQAARTSVGLSGRSLQPVP